jgi:nucleotide-binding universal stress UspA family protein
MDLHAILVATDFSHCACAAFKAAKTLGQRLNAKIILLHVINSGVLERLADYLKVEAESLIPEMRERAQQQMQAFLEKCSAQEREVESMVTVGVPFQEIAVIARDLAVDMVVMGGYGRRGRGPIEEVFFGSTAEKVVRLLPCPVLCVPLPEVEK